MENQIKRLGSLKSLGTSKFGVSPKTKTPCFELKDGELVFAGKSCKDLDPIEIWNTADVVLVNNDYKALAVGSIELKALVLETVGA